MIWFFYNLLFPVVYLLMLPGFLLRMARRGGYLANFGHRFGRYSAHERRVLAGPPRIWVHSVSVGEVQVGLKLVARLREQMPDALFVLTVTTSTADRIARQQAHPDDLVLYFPVDFPWVVRRVLGIIRPRAFIMVETELWPNLLRQLSRRGVPIALINGRISDRSFPRYRKIRCLTRRLLPRIDLSALFPQAAARWIEARGGHVLAGQRVESLTWQAPHWQVGDQAFDRVLLATSAPHAVQIAVQTAQAAPRSIADQLHAWAHGAAALKHRAITTVYAQAEAGGARTLLRAPMLALRSGPGAPAQFVFERDAITRPAQATRLLAFGVSASEGDRGALEAAITQQAQAQLRLRVTPLLTVTERRATFACTPALARPPLAVAPGLLACGDYVEGPYPATLEGAVRSGLLAVEAMEALR